jgi:hypothetical protein
MMQKGTDFGKMDFSKIFAAQISTNLILRSDTVEKELFPTE